jgi:uncharacterized repeat protein (TIGR01451 family)
MTVSLIGGYSITFNLHVSGGPVAAHVFPTYPGAFLGNRGFYTGVGGKPALYQTTSGTTTTATLTNIAVTGPSGTIETGYAFVGADAETTDTGESITWTSNTPFRLISTLGNACNAGLTGVGTNTVRCSATVSNNKTGTPILSAQAPTTISQVMVGSGLQGVAFGVMVSSVRLNKTVDGRIDPSDSFGLSIHSSSGSLVGSASTGTASTASTGIVPVLTSDVGSVYTYGEQFTSGLPTNYITSWSCTRNGASDPSLPSGEIGLSASVKLGIGDFVDCTITNTARTVRIGLVKKASPPDDVNGNGLTDAGDTIGYRFFVKNLGELPLSSIAVSDPKIGPVTCPVPTLLPGQVEVCTAAHYTITDADVAAGSVQNTATASGVPPGTTIRTESLPSSTLTPTEAPAPQVSLVKSGAASSGNTGPLAVGETIQYSYLVTNTGNVKLTSVAVDDPTQSPVTCPAIPAPGLAIGDSVTCMADNLYTVTAADVAAGFVKDTATATGTGDTGGTSPPSDPSTVIIEAEAPAPQVTISKSADVTPAAHQDAAQLGDSIAYSYLVTNTGNVNLTSVAVDDPTIGPVTCPAIPPPGLAIGDSVTCTADSPHIVSQADIDAGQVTDTATATGVGEAGGTSPPSDPSTVTVPTVDAAPLVSIVKSGTVDPAADQGGVKVGDTISYSYVVTNTGNVTLSSVSVTDPTVGSVTCPDLGASGLAVGDSVTCTADTPHTVTQADVDAGSITDSAFATGTGVRGGDSPPSDPSTVTIPAAVVVAVSVEKQGSVDPAGDQSGARLGDTISYTYIVTNTGSVTLTSVAVNDPTIGPVTCPAPAPPGLAPLNAVVCTADNTHTVTAADVAAGSVTDTATATGTGVIGGTSPPSDPSTVTIPTEPPAPQVGIAKAGLVTPAAHQLAAGVGDTIAYSYLVTNIGNVELTSVAVNDPTLGAVTCPAIPPPGLAPGDSVTCTADATHTVTQADVDAGQIVDTATATGVGAAGGTSPESLPSTATVPTVAAAPQVAIRKVGDVTPASHQGAAQQGDTIAYSYVVTNTGNVTLASVSVHDPTIGTVTCPTPPAPGLAPGLAVTCTADHVHTVTAADVAAGFVTDTATATGTDTNGNTSPRSAPSTVRIPTAGTLPHVPPGHGHGGSGNGGSQSSTGLGLIATDLGRPASDPGPARAGSVIWLAGGLALLAMAARTGRRRLRRRRRHA